jgi:hypothetical protein
MQTMVDLFSGLGGASEAFLKAGWDVYRFDNNRAFSDINSEYFVPQTKYADLRNTMLTGVSGGVDFVWASPPCYEFSHAFSAPQAIASREKRLEEYEPDMTLLENTISMIEAIKPRYWCIENVVGSIRYFEPYLGKPNITVGPYVLWGNFPPGCFEMPEGYSKSNAGDANRWSPIRSNHRAKVPLWLSQQMLDAIRYQTQITEWL